MTPTYDRLMSADDEVVTPVDAVTAAYGGLPPLEPSTDLPALVTNFAVSLDGKVSFGPSHPSPRHLTGGALHDRWLMGLLRARVDAVLIGARTLWVDRSHLWTAAEICPEDARVLARVRAAEGRADPPLCVIATRSGHLPPDARVLAGVDQPALVVTTSAGARVISQRFSAPAFDVAVAGDDVTPHALLAALADRACARVLSEAGPGLYVPFLEAGIAHDIYLTLCPVIVGGDERGALSLAHGGGFAPDTAPRPVVRSLRAAAGQVYLRSVAPGV